MLVSLLCRSYGFCLFLTLEVKSGALTPKNPLCILKLENLTLLFSTSIFEEDMTNVRFFLENFNLKILYLTLFKFIVINLNYWICIICEIVTYKVCTNCFLGVA